MSVRCYVTIVCVLLIDRCCLISLSTLHNILGSKGAWPGSRDLLFRCRDPFLTFLMGEARHFVFSLLDRPWRVLSDEWWMTPKEAWSGSRDILFKFWDPLRNFWTGEYESALKRLHDSVRQSVMTSTSLLQRLSARQHLNVVTTTSDSPSVPQSLYYNVWHFIVMSTSSLQRPIVRLHIIVFATTSSSPHLYVLTTTSISPPASQRPYYKVTQSVFSSTSSQQRLTVRHHLIFSSCGHPHSFMLSLVHTLHNDYDAS